MAVGSGHPLCSERARALLFTSFSAATNADALAQEFTSLQTLLRAQPWHHFKTFLEKKSMSASEPVEASATDAAKEDAAYYACYAKAVEKAVGKCRLPAACRHPPLQERCSQKHMELRSQGPWLRAQADVYALIGEHMAKQEGCEEGLSEVLERFFSYC